MLAPLRTTTLDARLSVAQRRAPYAEAVRAFAAARPASFTVPGHGSDPKAGAQHLVEQYGELTPSIDLATMIPGIDLGEDSALAKAQSLAAEAWGARRTWFVTNGASQANRMSALAVRGLGERVLIQRSSHSSFTDGVLLSGLIPATVRPSIDEVNGIAHGLTPERLAEALDAEIAAGRPASSVYVVSPSYFGSVSDIAGLASAAHERGAAIIVDGAWGAHFGFHAELPESPVRLGADLVISSTHKLGGSFTQSAMLHLGDGPFADRLEPLVERAFSMTASTSTSALLLGSLDLARRELVVAEDRIDRAIDASRRLREWVRGSEDYGLVSDGFSAYPDVVETDPLRVAIDVSGIGRSGHWVRETLASDYGVNLEMSTASTVVAVIGALADPDIARLTAALQAAAVTAASLGVEEVARFPRLPEAGRLVCAPREAYFAESETVEAAQAIGRVSVDTLAAYPPGIPNLLPGEEVTRETVEFLQAVAQAPTGYVRGAADQRVATLRVMK